MPAIDEIDLPAPAQFVPNIHDEHLLSLIRRSGHIHLLTGSGQWEAPDATRRFSKILNDKNIPHEIDIWGHDMAHDWPTWRKMLPYYIDSRF